MNTNNTVISAGVELVNKGKQAAVEQQASYLVGCILNSQQAIKLQQDTIKAEQENLRKLGLNTVTQAEVFGTPLSGEPNMSQQTILNVIEKLNKSKQASIELLSQQHIGRIDNAKAAIKTHEKQIADFRDQLSKLSTDVVTVAQVLG